VGGACDLSHLRRHASGLVGSPETDEARDLSMFKLFLRRAGLDAAEMDFA
jgi:hypothetical protein